jgi:cell division protein FtsL
MARVNFLLLLVVLACALGVITAQHQSRRLFIDLESGQAAAKRLDEEYTQLQLELGTWATNKRVEAMAARALGMRLPEPGATRVITLGAPAPGAGP